MPKWENEEKERERKMKKAGRSCLAGKTLKNLPHETKGGGRCQLFCKPRKLLMPIYHYIIHDHLE